MSDCLRLPTLTVAVDKHNLYAQVTKSKEGPCFHSNAAYP